MTQRWVTKGGRRCDVKEGDALCLPFSFPLMRKISEPRFVPWAQGKGYRKGGARGQVAADGAMSLLTTTCFKATFPYYGQSQVPTSSETQARNRIYHCHSLIFFARQRVEGTPPPWASVCPTGCPASQATYSYSLYDSLLCCYAF